MASFRYRVKGIANDDGKGRYVAAWRQSVPGLLVTRHLWREAFNVTHAASSLIVAGPFDKRKQAKEAANRLAKLPIDWSKSQISIFKDSARMTDQQINELMNIRQAPKVKNCKRWRAEVLKSAKAKK